MEKFISVLKSGKRLNSQAREIVWRVSEFMIKETKTTVTRRIPIYKVIERTAAACGVGQRTVSKIRAEKRILDSSKGDFVSFSTLKKKGQGRKKTITELDDFDQCVIRRTVYDFYKTDHSLPTLKLLKNKLADSIGYKGSLTSLRRILKDLGFRWKKIENNRKVLIEQSDIRVKRIEYLKAIKKARDNKVPIVYIDESYILSSHVTQKGWCDESTSGYKKPISKGQRAIIVHAGGEMGFIPNACLIWKAGTKSGDFHDQMNGSNFLIWVEQRLIPNLPNNSVIVVDNASYHNTLVEKAPNSNSPKWEMVEWLVEKEIHFDPKLLKPELYAIIKKNKDCFKRFEFDELLNKYGHTVLRLPPYHPDLNPIEFVWGMVKNYVAQKNVTNKLEDTINICQEKLDLITKEDWAKVCNKVKETEKEYYMKEHLVDDITDRIIVRVNDSSTESDDDDLSDNDDEHTEAEEECVNPD